MPKSGLLLGIWGREFDAQAAQVVDERLQLAQWVRRFGTAQGFADVLVETHFRWIDGLKK